MTQEVLYNCTTPADTILEHKSSVTKKKGVVKAQLQQTGRKHYIYYTYVERMIMFYFLPTATFFPGKRNPFLGAPQ